LGEELTPVPLSDELRADFEGKLAKAQADLQSEPTSVDALIWVGRRQAYLGRYHQAIETFSQGIEAHPDEPRLYRHRGHRFITTRQFEKATVDLELAASMIAGREDRIEPDGLPNERGIPTSTLQSNIWYHLGLVRYLVGNFDGARKAYEACLEVSKNPDMLIATTYWLYMSLRRLDLPGEAARTLDPVSENLDIIENHEYFELLLLFGGETPLADLSSSDREGLGSATVGYGIGNWHLFNGRPDEATQAFQQVLGGDQWAAFGYIAAEAELARGPGG
jgi:tetratricopeptide (TPR) repeat protein